MKVKSAYNAARRGVTASSRSTRTSAPSTSSGPQLPLERRRAGARASRSSAPTWPTQLFGKRNSLGEPITLNGMPYTVVGKIRKKDQDSNYSGPDNDKVFVPFAAMARDFPRTDADARHAVGHHRRAAALGGRRAAARARRAHRPHRGHRLAARARTSARILARRHGFDPDGPQAIAMWDTSLADADVRPDDRPHEAVLHDRRHRHAGARRHRRDEHHAGGGAASGRARSASARRSARRPRAIQRQFFLEGFFLTMLSGGVGIRASRSGCVRSSTCCRCRRASRGWSCHWQSGAAGAGHAGRDRRRHVHLSGAPRRRSCRRSKRCGSRCEHERRTRDARRSRHRGRSPARPRAGGRARRCSVLREIVPRGVLSACYATAFAPALSMLGISWGIVSVVMLLAYGNGFPGALDAGFRGAFGDGTSSSSPGRPACRRAASAPASASASRLDDVLADRRAAAREDVSPEFMQRVPDRLGQQAVELSGARRGARRTASCAAQTPQAGGRFLDDEDVRLQRRVAFLGSEVRGSCSATSRRSARRSASAACRSRSSA